MTSQCFLGKTSHSAKSRYRPFTKSELEILGVTMINHIAANGGFEHFDALVASKP